MIAPVALPLSFSPDLVEEAVLRAVAGHAEEPAFRRARDPIYRLAPERREAAFEQLHVSWFERFALDEPLRTALGELPELAEGCARCIVSRAPSRGDETVDLLVADEPAGRAARSVLVRLRTAMLAEPSRLLGWLRVELLKVADMIDPAFGYRPALPASDDPAQERLARERYRAIWDASAIGRLARRGLAAEQAIDDSRRAFATAFPMLGPSADRAFDRFFDGESRAHAEWAALAAAPRAETVALAPGGRCPLCRFPTYSPEPAPEALPAPIVERIVAEFPGWRPAAGLCRQCADLYRAQEMSLQALAEIPGPPV